MRYLALLAVLLAGCSHEALLTEVEPPLEVVQAPSPIPTVQPVALPTPARWYSVRFAPTVAWVRNHTGREQLMWACVFRVYATGQSYHYAIAAHIPGDGSEYPIPISYPVCHFQADVGAYSSCDAISSPEHAGHLIGNEGIVCSPAGYP